MAFFIYVSLFACQAASVSCGSVDLLTDNISGAVGERVEIKWRLKFDQGESIGDSLFRVCPDGKYEKCFVSGDGKNLAVREVSSPFKDRVVAKYEEGLHVLIINNLNMTDEGRKIYPQAIFRKNAVDVTNIVKEELTIQVKAYPKLMQPLTSEMYFNNNDNPTIQIVASGIPRPTVAWKFRDKILRGSYSNNSKYEYTYEVTIPPLTRQSCGYELNYSISGWNSSVIDYTSTIYINFTPDKPEINTHTTEQNVKITWQQADYGQCSVKYTVDVLDKSLKVMKSIQTTKQSVDIAFTSKEERKNATNVKVTASYRGQQRSSVANIGFVPTNPPTTEEVVCTKCTGNIIGALMGGLVAGLMLGIVMTMISRRFMKQKKEAKNEASSMGNMDYDNVIAQGGGTTDINSPESNYTGLNMSNAEASNYMELQAAQNKNYVNVQQEYEILPTVR